MQLTPLLSLMALVPLCLTVSSDTRVWQFTHVLHLYHHARLRSTRERNNP